MKHLWAPPVSWSLLRCITATAADAQPVGWRRGERGHDGGDFSLTIYKSLEKVGTKTFTIRHGQQSQTGACRELKFNFVAIPPRVHSTVSSPSIKLSFTIQQFSSHKFYTFSILKLFQHYLVAFYSN